MEKIVVLGATGASSEFKRKKGQCPSAAVPCYLVSYKIQIYEYRRCNAAGHDFLSRKTRTLCEKRQDPEYLRLSNLGTCTYPGMLGPACPARLGTRAEIAYLAQIWGRGLEQRCPGLACLRVPQVWDQAHDPKSFFYILIPKIPNLFLMPIVFCLKLRS